MLERCDIVSRKTGIRCRNKAYREGYFRQGRKTWWSYLCRKHFGEMKGKDKRLEGWCGLD